MTVNLTIQAEIIDIRTDTPQPDDIFFVDTNVWFWQTYTNASISNPNALTKVGEIQHISVPLLLLEPP